jgi:hypothetical protein
MIDSKHPPKEARSEGYPFRREANVIEADGSLVLTIGKPKEGTAYAVQMALQYKKPHFLVDLKKRPQPIRVLAWGETCGIRSLNVAGPRESKFPGLYENAKQFLQAGFVGKDGAGEQLHRLRRTRPNLLVDRKKRPGHFFGPIFGRVGRPLKTR